MIGKKGFRFKTITDENRLQFRSFVPSRFNQILLFQNNMCSLIHTLAHERR